MRPGLRRNERPNQLEVALMDLQNSVLSTERQVRASQNLLKYQMGLDRNLTIVLTDGLHDQLAKVDYEAALGEVTLEEKPGLSGNQEQGRLAYMDV